MSGPLPDPSSVDFNDSKNVAKEMMQEMILHALSESGFFDVAAFHGGTCLRIIHGLDRFSEDLDFTLIEPVEPFDFTRHEQAITSEFDSIGVSVHMKSRQAKGELPIFSVMISAGLREVLKAFGFRDEIISLSHSKANISVKLDVDVTPPEVIRTEMVTKEGFRDYTVRVEPLSVLFAGKTSAVLCRRWGNRIKGRDMYDFRWYIQNGTPIALECLASRMDRKCIAGLEWNRDSLVDALVHRFDTLDWESAYEDVKMFLESPDRIGDWGPEPFKELARRIKVE